MGAQSFSHETVLLQEAVDALQVQGKRLFIDATFGRGGHSRFLLEQLDEDACLLVIDKDPQAIASAKALQEEDGRVVVCHGSLADIKEHVASLGNEYLGQVDGILMDLGLSSPQLDDAERGFSFMRDGPLDMRMNNSSGQSALEWVAEESEEEMTKVIKTFGEERFGKRIARAIAEARVKEAITTTKQLSDIASAAIPKWEKNKHPATRTFQAIRIAVNKELTDLADCLADSLDVLAPEGRLVVISFHSLEDRIVKQYMKKQAKGDDFPKGLPITNDQLDKKMKLIGKAVKASAAEVERNPRARSAIMRIAEKLS